MTDKIKEIRDRVEQDVAKGPANKEIYRVHKDRAFLLAEVDRLRKKMREIAEDCESEYPESYKKIAWGIRNALEGQTMSERLIDAVCPHCGGQGTTVRVVLHEDGYTKLSRRCTACGGEFIHTFDRDWLAVAKNKKLQADNERLTSDVALVAERVRQLLDERDYALAEVERQIGRICHEALEAKP